MAKGDATPLDAERARLREAGYTDDEISKYFVERLRGASQQSTAAGAAPAQGNMTGVLANASAVLSHARGTIPAIKADLGNLSNSTAPANSRHISALKLVGVAVVVAVLGYAIYQEWQQHIVSTPATAAAQVGETQAKALLALDTVRSQINKDNQENALFATAARANNERSARDDAERAEKAALAAKVALIPKSTLPLEQQIARVKELQAKIAQHVSLTESELVELQVLVRDGAVDAEIKIRQEAWHAKHDHPN